MEVYYGFSSYRPQGKVMFSQASVILSTIGLMAIQITADPCYSAVGIYASYWNAFLFDPNNVFVPCLSG